MSIIRYWNDLAQRLVADDHTGTPPPANRGGPVQTSYALALLHLALHDTVARTGGTFTAYHHLPADAPAGTDQPQALTGAFVTMARHLYPAHHATIQAALDAARNMLGVAHGPFNTDEKYGESVANELIKRRLNDGTVVLENYEYKIEPGKHRPDPVQPGQGALGSKWGDVLPFTYAAGAHPPLPGPPGLHTKKYLTAYHEVYEEGRSDIALRKPQQAMMGVFWGYDGPQKLGTPPRLYNQVVRTISDPLTLSLEDEVRLLTLVNVGMADAGIACWHHKYEFDFWRPVVGIREADSGAGPSGMKDPTGVKAGDPFWLPLGLPHTNAARPAHCTPGFPAYPSGHSTFGATAFLLTALFLGKKPSEIKFEFVSDEFNGVNRDDHGVIRPRLNRPLDLQTAIDENAASRVYLGVHWRFDATDGITLAEALIDGIESRFGSPRGPGIGAGPAAAATAPVIPPQPARRQQVR